MSPGLGKKTPASSPPRAPSPLTASQLLAGVILEPLSLLPLWYHLVLAINRLQTVSPEMIPRDVGPFRAGGPSFCDTPKTWLTAPLCLPRAHRNDMETIYPFLFLGLVYSFLGPNPFVAQMHFLVFFLGRVVHTVAYLGKLRAPTRSLAYTVAQLPCASMALQIIWEAAHHL